MYRPKPMSDWKEEVEVEAFKNAVLKSLESLETFFDGQDELDGQEPGMASKMVQKIIDNV